MARRLEPVVRRSVAAMHWLTDADRGMVELALTLAARMDEAAKAGPEESAKAAGWLGPQLANCLRSLGGSPAERAALGVERQVRGRLAELRAARERRGA